MNHPKNRDIVWMFVVVLAACGLTIFMFRDMVFHPSKAVHNLGGDAIKNYYVFLTHSLWGNGWWFDGMNYPYGEHIIYVDGTPALSIPLSWIRNVIPLDIHSVTATLNVTMGLAFALGIVYVYKTIHLLKVSRYWALLFALFIMAMNPQFNRVYGHYGLAIMCFVPMMTYWLIQYYHNNQKKYAIYILILSCIAMFFHPYWAAIFLVFAVSYVVGYWLFNKVTFKTKLRHIVPIISAPILAMMLLKIVITTTDTLTDRPLAPYGTLAECVTGRDMLTSDYSFFWSALEENKIIAKTGMAGSESYAYTGLVPLVVTLIVIVLILVGRFKKKKIASYGGDKKFNKMLLFIAFATLLLSMGVPFVWGMDWLLDYIAAFRQFRSMGRFAFVYYYIITIVASVLLYSWYSDKARSNKVKLGTSVFVLGILLWAAEAYSFAYTSYRTSRLKFYNYEAFTSTLEVQDKTWNSFLTEEGIHPSEFQAILALPYVHIGSEKIWLSDDLWGGFCLVTRACYQLKLPMVNACMSRSSWSKTFDQVKISAGPFVKKPLFDSISSDNDMLLLVYDQHQLTPDEQFLVSVADSIGKYEQQFVYRLSLSKLKAIENDIESRIVGTLDTNHQEFSITRQPYYYEHYNNGASEYSLIGKADTPRYHTYEFASINTTGWLTDSLYEFSFWALVSNEDYKSPEVVLFQYNAKGVQLALDSLHCKVSIDNHDLWLRGNKYFTLRKECATLNAAIKYPKDNTYLAMDEVLLRSASDTIVYFAPNGTTMVNNHIYKQDR